MAVFMCILQREMSFEFSLILSTVDLSKHLIMAWNIRKFIQLVIFVTLSVFYFFFGNRVWLNLNERALSGNETAIITGSFYLWKRSCKNLFNVEPFFVFHTESVMLGPRFIPGSIFYTQSVMLSPCFISESVFHTQFVVRSNNNNNNQRYLVRVALNSKADKPVALISGSNWKTGDGHNKKAPNIMK